MLSVGIVSSAGMGYYLSTVGSGVDDYYARTEPGTWVGAGAQRLGLSGDVDASQVDALAEGHHPLTGVPLGVRVQKVAAFDLTFSAPKSVSVLAELADRPTGELVEEAHRSAVTATVRFLEAEGVLTGRRGPGGVDRVATEGAVAAAFVHRTSRAGDPQLHTHLLVFNRARGVDGRWGGLDGRRLFGWAKTAGYIYQAALRDELTRRLGVEWTPVHNGVADVAGFAPEQLEEFSTRRSQIESALVAAGHGTARAAQVATLATRPPKPEPVDPARQRLDWWARGTAVGLTPDRLAELTPLAPGQRAIGPEHDAAVLAGPTHRTEPSAEPQTPPHPGTQSVTGLAARLAAADGLTAHASTFDRRDVLRAVAQSAPTGAAPGAVAAAADAVLSDPAIVPSDRDGRMAGRLYSTVDLISLEQAALAAAGRLDHAGSGTCSAAAVGAALASRPGLGDEQRAMVERLCTSGRGVDVVVGRAGTGKTFALDAARQAWESSGHTVIGTALAARTAAGLQAGTGIASTTVDQLLADLSRPGPAGTLPPHTVVVVDEAGMVGTRKLAALLSAAERTRAKVVLVGDPRQLPEVEAGGLFAALADQDPVELTVNRRQDHAWERAALDELRHGDVGRAVTAYREHQRITLHPTADSARDALVDRWWTARAELGADRVLMIGLTRADVNDLNDRARARLRSAGRLGADGLTASGREFAVGDEVMALRNDRRIGLLNGTRATVTDLDHAQGSMHLETADGRAVTLPAGYLQAGNLAHGYAVTAHKAQGVTTGRAFVLGSDRLYREAGYTALSRATDRTELHAVAASSPGWEPAAGTDGDLTRLLRRSAAQTLASTPPGGALDRAAVRDAALADPGPHLLDRLGPPPPAGPARAAWAAAATAIDTYRYRHHVTGPDPLGPAPVDDTARREWEHAMAATAQVDRHRSPDLDRHLGL